MYMCTCTCNCFTIAHEWWVLIAELLLRVHDTNSLVSLEAFIINHLLHRYNGRPLSGARVTTCWLDHKNMKELGITEDMIYSNPITGKDDSYEKDGGKRLWMGRYQGSRKKIASSERDTSSSARYDNEHSKGLTSPSYKTHVVSRVDVASSVVGASLSKISIETKSKESKEYRSSTQERLSSQSSGNGNQGIEKERSISKSLSLASCTMESLRVGGKKRRLTSGDSINIQLHPRKLHESESDNSVFKEKGKVRDCSLKKKGQSVDGRSRNSPSKRVSEYIDDEKPKEVLKYSPRSENVSFRPSPLQSEANTSISAAAQLDEMLNPIHSMDFKNFPEVSVTESVKQEPLHRIDLDCDQVESLGSAQLDAHQIEPESQSSCSDMPCIPPISAFDFERDETPPAEIVEATAEWYRTQNFPVNFSSVSLQHVFQYYKSSMAVDGTDNKNEGGVWHSQIWPGRIQRRDQLLEQSLATTSSDVTNPVHSSQSAFYSGLQSANHTGESSSSASNVHTCSHSSVHSSPITKGSKQANLATILHQDPMCTYSACEQLPCHLHNATDGDTHCLSDGEIQEHLKLFLTKQEAEAIEDSIDSESVPMSGTQAGVETISGLTRCTTSGQVNHTVRHYNQQGKEASTFDLTPPYYSRGQNIYTTPENHENSYLTTTVEHSDMQQEGNQRLSQDPSSPNYLFNEQIPAPRGNKDYKRALTQGYLFPLSSSATMNETPASIAENFHHRYDQERSELSRNQWKESKQPSSKGLWRTEELGLTREREDETTPFVVHACRLSHLDSSLAAGGDVHGGDTSTSTFSNQVSLDSVIQASSLTASQVCNMVSCIHKEEVGKSQLQRLNQPTIGESYQYHNPSRDHHKQAKSMDFVSSPFSSYQHADVDKLRVSSPEFRRGPPQPLNTDRGDVNVLPNRSELWSTAKSMYTSLQQISQPDINPVSRDENEPEKCNLLRVPQKTLNDPKKDQPRRLLREELATKDSDIDDAEEVSNKALVLDAHKPTCTEQSLGVRSDDTARISVADMQALQSLERLPIADKYKRLQKCYYKVN